MTTATKTRREKVAAMAEQSASPEEAEVAQAMLATMKRPRLEAIHEDIMSSWNRGIEEEFRVGRLLSEAAALLDPTARSVGADGKVTGSPYGDWFRAKEFPFSMKTAQRLRIAADREPEVRALIEGKVGRDMGVNTAVAQLLAGPKPSTGEAEPITDTTPVHRAYDAMRLAHRLLVTEGGFEDMHVDDMVKVAGFITNIVEAYKAERGKR